MPADATAHPIDVGIMRVDVGGRDARSLAQVTAAASERFTDELSRLPRLRVRQLAFDGTQLGRGREGYRALDFVQVGINEKTERKLAFLLLVTEVEISASSLSYLLALPSQLTNVAVLSTRRLADLGSDDLDDADLMTDRLAALMLQCFGRLVNLPYRREPDNYMYDLTEPAELDAMRAFTEEQWRHVEATLPVEANDRFSGGEGRLGFVVRQAAANLPRIVRAALRANPLRIATKLPTMIATALSAIVVLIFGGETWDFAASVTPGQLAVFVAACFAAATFVLYRAFSFELISARHGSTAESSVVTACATALALALTLAVLFGLFGALMYGVVVFVFPDALMRTWTSAHDGSTAAAHLRLVTFLAAVGVLTGSLGGSADSRSVVRGVLFGGDGR